MVRFLVRGAAAALAVFVALMSVLMIEEDESSHPWGTEVSFTMSVASSSVSKADLIQSLDGAVDSKGILLVKVAADPRHSASALDLVWFGTAPHDTALTWFDQTLGGRALPSSDLGERPLDGYYAMSDCSGCALAVTSWARANGVSLDWDPPRSLRGVVTRSLTSSGAGFALISVVVLLMSVAITWFSAQARSRSLRLLGGVSPGRIHTWDVWRFLRTVVAWSVGAWAISCAVIAVQRGVGRVGVFASWSLSMLAAVLGGVGVACLAISWLTRPTVTMLARRQPPATAAKNLGVVVRSFAVVIAATVLPFAMYFAQTAHGAYLEASRWSDATGAVKLTFSGAYEGDTLKPYRAGLTTFMADADAADLTAMSFSMDQALNMSAEELGQFDHVIITDPAFLALMHVDYQPGVGGPGFAPVDHSALAPALRSTLDDELEILTIDKTAEPNGVHYFAYTGDEPLPAIGYSLTGGSPIEARHPLVIVADHPLTTFTPEGFLLSTMVNGNLVFTDADELRALLNKEHLGPLVISIDNVADETLDAAHSYAQQAQLGVVAVLLVALAIVVALIQTAQTWASSNQRRIFALHSAGRSYWLIQRRQIAFQALFIVAVCAIAAMLASAMYKMEGSPVIPVIGPIIPLYLIGAVVAHHTAARTAFALALHRRA